MLYLTTLFPIFSLLSLKLVPMHFLPIEVCSGCPTTIQTSQIVHAELIETRLVWFSSFLKHFELSFDFILSTRGSTSSWISFQVKVLLRGSAGGWQPMTCIGPLLFTSVWNSTRLRSILTSFLHESKSTPHTRGSAGIRQRLRLTLNFTLLKTDLEIKLYLPHSTWDSN